MYYSENGEEFDVQPLDEEAFDYAEELFGESTLSLEEIAKHKRELAMRLEEEGFLPENDELSEEPNVSQAEVEAHPRKYIIEECVPACQELWSKNIYTFMVSDHLDKGKCWVEIIFDNLSDENKKIYQRLTGEGILKFSYHKGAVNFGVSCVGKEGQTKLLELAKHFKMQDVPEGEAYISVQKFLMDYCDCYDEVPNPQYEEMKPVYEMDFKTVEEMSEYMINYDEWSHSEKSKKTLRIFNPNKTKKPIVELVKEHGKILEGDRVYLSDFHYKKHKKYLEHIQSVGGR